MSSSDTANQFFPPTLKKISISFFAILIVGIAAIAYYSPQSLLQKHHQSKSDTQPQATITPPQGQALAQSTTATPTPTTNTDTAHESITTQPDTSHSADQPPSATPSPTPTVHSSNQPNSSCPGSSKPIKGVILNGQKIYFKLGMQDYYRISEMLPVSAWFCNESDAKAAGWIRATTSAIREFLQ